MGFYPRGPRGAATFHFVPRASSGRSFYPRGPRGAATGLCGIGYSRRVFLSARPARGRDSGFAGSDTHAGCFYPRGPRGAATRRIGRVIGQLGVSIRAARAGPRH